MRGFYAKVFTLVCYTYLFAVLLCADLVLSHAMSNAMTLAVDAP